MAKNSQARKKSNILSNIVFLLVCIVLVGAFSRLISHQAASYNSLRALYEYTERQRADARAEYYALNYQIAHFDSDAYIERLARERLGWARPNEIIFRERSE